MQQLPPPGDLPVQPALPAHPAPHHGQWRGRILLALSVAGGVVGFVSLGPAGGAATFVCGLTLTGVTSLCARCCRPALENEPVEDLDEPEEPEDAQDIPEDEGEDDLQEPEVILPRPELIVRPRGNPERLREACEFFNTIVAEFEGYQHGAGVDDQLRNRWAELLPRFRIYHNRLEGFLPNNQALLAQLQGMVNYLQDQMNFAGLEGMEIGVFAKPDMPVLPRLIPENDQAEPPPPLLLRQPSLADQRHQEEIAQVAHAVRYAGQVLNNIHQHPENDDPEPLRIQAGNAAFLLERAPDESLREVLANERPDVVEHVQRAAVQLHNFGERLERPEPANQQWPNVEPEQGFHHSLRFDPPPCGLPNPALLMGLPQALDGILDGCQLRTTSPNADSGYVACTAAFLHHLLRCNDRERDACVEALKQQLEHPAFQAYVTYCQGQNELLHAKGLLNAFVIDHSDEALDALLMNRQRLQPLVNTLRMLVGYEITRRDGDHRFTQCLFETLRAQGWDALDRHCEQIEHPGMYNQKDVLDVYSHMLATRTDCPVGQPEMLILADIFPQLHTSFCEYDERLPAEQQNWGRMQRNGQCNILALHDDLGTRYSAIIVPAGQPIAAVDDHRPPHNIAQPLEQPEVDLQGQVGGELEIPVPDLEPPEDEPLAPEPPPIGADTLGLFLHARDFNQPFDLAAYIQELENDRDFDAPPPGWIEQLDRFLQDELEKAADKYGIYKNLDSYLRMMQGHSVLTCGSFAVFHYVEPQQAGTVIDQLHLDAEGHFNNKLLSAEQANRIRRINDPMACQNEMEHCLEVHNTYLRWLFRQVVRIAVEKNLVTWQQRGEYEGLAHFTPLNALLDMEHNDGVLDVEVRFLASCLDKIRDNQLAEEIAGQMPEHRRPQFLACVRAREREQVLEMMIEHLGPAATNRYLR
ncbi:hypothetical protein [Parendozoicomonas haliclonae]|uniref:Uncharacterized protein n=1 Tax=Parendozoicomonas haliclonae TaxID=1960125 RepID=A0A1X7AP94_9GAMM|nr:hypothetical protein [Parendozoicomonas haliclonae]SMA50075.1 hypothetical protein EHSB41UT_03866 [Parendozoicomonas haliclonae]